MFLNPELLPKYEKFLKPYFKTKEENKLYSYVKKFWLEKDYNIFKNNISESFHSKLNY